MRATRDLLRRRLHFVRKRGQLLVHIQNTNHQYNLPGFEKRIAYTANRDGVVEHFGDEAVRKSIALDVALVDRYDDLIAELELYLVRKAKIEEPRGFQLLRSIPGVGKVLAMTILYEIHDIHRFARVQEFRLLRPAGAMRQGVGGEEARHRGEEDRQRASQVDVVYNHTAEGNEHGPTLCLGPLKRHLLSPRPKQGDLRRLLWLRQYLKRQ